ncbi:hypothetical protein AB7M49_004151 [Bradyrhizobium elkanii]
MDFDMAQQLALIKRRQSKVTNDRIRRSARARHRLILLVSGSRMSAFCQRSEGCPRKNGTASMSLNVRDIDASAGLARVFQYTDGSKDTFIDPLIDYLRHRALARKISV